MFVNEDMAKNGVHAFAGMRHGCLEVQALRGGFFAALVKCCYPALGVVKRFFYVNSAFHGFAAAGHYRFGLQTAQGFQRCRPFFQLRVAGVHACLVFD